MSYVFKSRLRRRRIKLFQSLIGSISTYKVVLVFMLSLSGWVLTAADFELATHLGESTGANMDDYCLGPGDVIQINVESIPEISTQYTVSETGSIIFPKLLSTLKVQGLTAEQLRVLLTKLLAEYMYEPRVMVDILGYHSHKVLVLGPFQKPGKYELRRERVPLLDIILEAGGVRELGERDELVILRTPSLPDPSGNGFVDAELSNMMRTIRIDLQALLRDGDLTQNVMIQSGDVIYLTSFFASGKYVYVAGSGRRGAGAISYEQGLTAFKALLRAGVVPDDQQGLDLVIVRRQDGSDHFINTQIKFDPMNPGEGDLILLPEDIVILPETTSQVVYVAGEVNRPGTLTYQEGLTILQAILDAGGMSKGAVGAKVKVLRADDLGGRKQIPVDMDAVLKGEDDAQNIALIPGDIIVIPGMSLEEDIRVTGKVNSPGLVSYEPGMTAMKAIFLAGGLKDNALKSQIRIVSNDGSIQPPILLDMTRAQLEEVESSNPALKPGDLMMVLGPAPGNIIYILGQVQRPGIIDYENGLTVLQAIMRVGGFSQGAARSKVRVVRGESEQQRLRVNLEDLMNRGDRSADITLLPGDIIIVPETFF